MRRATLGALPALSVAVLSACAAGEVPATVLDAIPEAWHLTPPPPLPEKGSGFGTLKAFAFKSDAEGWSASPGVELSVSEPGVLRIKGAERKNLWTFASLPSVDVPPGRFVLLRFEYRIESADAETYSPHVWLGQYGFETKDGKQEKVRRATCRTPDLPLFPLGEWRAMDLEIPPDAKAAKLEASLSKGVREPRSVDLSIRNVALLLHSYAEPFKRWAGKYSRKRPWLTLHTTDYSPGCQRARSRLSWSDKRSSSCNAIRSCTCGLSGNVLFLSLRGSTPPNCQRRSCRRFPEAVPLLHCWMAYL